MMYNIFILLLIISYYNIIAINDIKHQEWYVPPTTNRNIHKSCDLIRLKAIDFIDEDGTNNLLEKLNKLNVPIIIEGGLEHWSALKLWQNKTYFLNNFGNIDISDTAVVSRALDVAQSGTSSKPEEFTGATLGSYISTMNDFDDNDMNSKHKLIEFNSNIESESESALESSEVLFTPLPYSKPFLFQRAKPDKTLLNVLGRDLENGISGSGSGTTKTTGATDTGTGSGTSKKDKQKKKKNKGGIRPPPYMRPLGFNHFHIVSIGSTALGLPHHKHTASWLGLIVGEKHWSVLPPNSMSPESFESEYSFENFNKYVKATLQSPSQWSTELKSELKEKQGVYMNDCGVYMYILCILLICMFVV